LCVGHRRANAIRLHRSRRIFWMARPCQLSPLNSRALGVKPQNIPARKRAPRCIDRLYRLYQNGTFMTPIPPRAPAHPKQATSPRIGALALALAVVAITSFGCAKEPDTWEQHLSRANDYSAAQQWDKAETEYREVLRLAPENPAALRHLGILYLDQGQTLQAYPLLKKI